jgi:hypothetical protein
MIWTVLALACIVLAFVGEIVDERVMKHAEAAAGLAS